MTLITLFIGLLVGYVIYLLLSWIGAPAPLPVIGGIIAFILFAFGGDRFGRLSS
jgi:hypothetical protein